MIQIEKQKVVTVTLVAKDLNTLFEAVGFELPNVAPSIEVFDPQYPNDGSTLTLTWTSTEGV